MVYLEKQVQQFALVRGNISEALGPAKAASFVSEALFVISVGSNDILDFASNKSGLSLSNEQYLAFLQLNYDFKIRVLNYIHTYKFDSLFNCFEYRCTHELCFYY